MRNTCSSDKAAFRGIDSDSLLDGTMISANPTRSILSVRRSAIVGRRAVPRRCRDRRRVCRERLEECHLHSSNAPVVHMHSALRRCLRLPLRLRRKSCLDNVICIYFGKLIKFMRRLLGKGRHSQSRTLFSQHSLTVCGHLRPMQPEFETNATPVQS
jgi:hypothetical protein